ncbi:MAG: hypothetical protein HQK60_06650 [Deltaproteobacteria bacterium]|nr:hypothetical protein [Deltaproteobacteria bacterium]
MSIRMLAAELYRALKKVEELKEKLEKGSPLERVETELALYRAQAEYNDLKRTMDAKKTSEPKRTYS